MKSIKKIIYIVFTLGLFISNTAFAQANPPAVPLSSDTAVRYFDVPFYSQFNDIKNPRWQKEGCGIASLAMVIDFYKPNTVSVAKLLNQAINSGAYLNNIGWKHKELSALAGNYGLAEKNYDLGKSGNSAAFAQFLGFLKSGPVIVSIHNKFDPKATLGHIVVVTGFENNFIYYKDPAGNSKEEKIPVKNFLNGWKRRFIIVREKSENSNARQLSMTK